VNELDQNLLTGESVVFATKKHWFSPVRDSLVAALLIIGSFLARSLTPDGDGLFGTLGNIVDVLANIALIVGIAWIIWNVFAFFSANFGVTNMRVLRYEGIIQRRSSETLLTGIQDIRLREPGLGRMLGFGDLEIFTAAGDAGKDQFSTIRDAGKMRTAVLEQKTQGPGGYAAAPAAPAPAPAPVAEAVAVPSTASLPTPEESAATLARLADMRDQGLITAEDFEAKKTEILGRM
jgi:uncharacterized membrane protein YdbT with pleckstrin-like domain